MRTAPSPLAEPYAYQFADHSVSWSAGAFAFFGPGKFNSTYTALTTPAAGGRLHFAGEALSTRHAWVEGALNSAWRAVYELLIQEPAWKHLMQKFYKNWGYDAEWFASPEKAEPGEPGGASGLSASGAAASLAADVEAGPGRVLWAPYGRWQPGMDKDEDGKLDLDKLARSSLLVKHIAVSQDCEERRLLSLAR